MQRLLASLLLGAAVLCTNIAAAALRPVVFVPGTGASQLFVTTSNFNPGSAEVWLDFQFNPFTGFLIDDDELLHNLRLRHADSTDFNMAPFFSDVTGLGPRGNIDLGYWDQLIDQLGDGGFPVQFHEDLRAEFEARGYRLGTTLFVSHYNWLDDWSDACAQLGSVVGTALARSGADKVHLVGHSQGTQVIDACLTEYLRSSLPGRVASVIHFGPPYTGGDADRTWANTVTRLGGSAFVPFSADSTSLTLGQTAPAVYLLSPTQRFESRLFSTYGIVSSFQSVVETYDSASRLLSRTVQPSSNSTAASYNFSQTFDQRLARHTQTRHGVWDNGNNRYSLPLLTVRGQGIDTPVSIQYVYQDFPGSDDVDVNVTERSGDGTVPAISSDFAFSRSLGIRQQITITDGGSLSADHTDMLSGNTIATLMNSYVYPFLRDRGGLNSAATATALAQSAEADAPVEPESIVLDGRTGAELEEAPAREEAQQVFAFGLPIDGAAQYRVEVSDRRSGNSKRYVLDAEGDLTDLAPEVTERGWACHLRSYRLAVPGVEDATRLSVQMRMARGIPARWCRVSLAMDTEQGDSSAADLTVRRYRDSVGYPAKRYGRLTLTAEPVHMRFDREGRVRFLRAGEPVRFE